MPSVSDVRNHWIDTNLFGHNRVFFDTSPGPSEARLKVFNVSEADDGLYRCRVDFKASQTRTSRVNLTVIGRHEDVCSDSFAKCVVCTDWIFRGRKVHFVFVYR